MSFVFRLPTTHPYQNFDMLETTISDYGPFAPVVGYAGAIMAAGFVLFAMWGGKMQKWRPPDEDLPGTAQTIVLLLCGVGMVLQWYFAAPDAIGWFISAFAVLSIFAVVCFLHYSSLLGLYIYTKKVAVKQDSTRDERILGGRNLLPEAEEKRRKLAVDIQTLLEGAAYNPDILWSRQERQWVKQRVLIFFILTLVLGTSALTGASFTTQVLLTKEAATSVITTTDSPGLEGNSKTNQTKPNKSLQRKK